MQLKNGATRGMDEYKGEGGDERNAARTTVTNEMNTPEKGTAARTAQIIKASLTQQHQAKQFLKMQVGINIRTAQAKEEALAMQEKSKPLLERLKWNSLVCWEWVLWEWVWV